MPVQKEPYRYMTQSSSEGLLPTSRLATAASVAWPVRGGFAPDEKERMTTNEKLLKLHFTVYVNKIQPELLTINSRAHNETQESNRTAKL